jgi:uncharacterized MAPEG superfamily protein
MSTRRKKDRRLTKLEFEPQVPEFSVWAAFRKSPFPPPTELEKYELLYPGVAKQFFDNFTNQSNHRMELEKIVIQGDNKRADVAQRNSFIIILALIIMAIVLFILGKDTQAIVAVVSAMVPVIISFINSTIKRKDERESKRKNLGIN